MIEHSLLKLLLSREFYLANQDRVSPNFFEGEIKSIYDTIIAAQKKYEHDLTLDEVKSLHFMHHPTLSRASRNVLEEIFVDLDNLSDFSHDIGQTVLEGLWKRETFREIAEIGVKGVEGQEIDLERVRKLIDARSDSFIPDIGKGSGIEYVDNDLDYLLEATDRKNAWQINIPSVSEKLPGLAGGEFLIIAARPEAGKCLNIDTPILMYNGDIKMVQDIVVGDQIMGPDSTPRLVQSLATGSEEMYKVSYPWGDSYTVNKSHILSLKRSKKETKHKNGDILNVSVEDYLTWGVGRKHRYKGWKTGVVFSNALREYTIPPRLLGIWLGDGKSTAGVIYNIDPEIISYLYEVANEMGLEVRNKGINYTLTHKRRSLSFTRMLQQQGLSNNKHIPKEYLLGSVDARREVLAGLLDTDGHMNKEQSSYEITLKVKRLADDVVFLSRSLGHHATIKQVTKTATNGRPGNIGTYYRVTIGDNLGRIPTLIPRKSLRGTLFDTKRQGLHFGIKVEPVGVGDYYGFTLDGDGLFVLGDFTVTHNTSSYISLSCAPNGWAWQGAKVLIVANEEPGRRTLLRCVTAACGKNADWVRANKRAARETWDEIADQVILADAVGCTMARLEALVRIHQPNILVVDQADKVSVSGSYSASHEKLREVYIQLREIAKRYDTVVIGISQASADAEGKSVVNFSMLEGSKTGKAAEADVICTIGKFPQGEGQEEDFTRIWNFPKNKISGFHGSIYTILDPETSTYRS